MDDRDTPAVREVVVDVRAELEVLGRPVLLIGRDRLPHVVRCLAAARRRWAPPAPP